MFVKNTYILNPNQPSLNSGSKGCWTFDHLSTFIYFLCHSIMGAAIMLGDTCQLELKLNLTGEPS